ncbi:MAG: type II secretion system protein [Candidatus Paceibacterota bacterium]|jgi:type II secretory pathway pseudopilin PulG
MGNRIFKKKGFTLIEMMVTLSIVTLLTVMVLVYSRQSEKVTNLIRDSDKMVFELRRAQNLAMLTLQPSIQPICGWGIYINKESVPQTQYILFSDFCDGVTPEQYDLEEKFETVNLLKGVKITEANIFSITFVPPEPQVKFYPILSGGEIKMCLEAKSNVCYTIYVSPAGQIYKK